MFLSVSLSIKGNDGFVTETTEVLGQNNKKCSEETVAMEFKEIKENKVSVRRGGAMNTTKHLWAGAVAAMVSRLVFTMLRKYFYLLSREPCSYT